MSKALLPAGLSLWYSLTPQYASGRAHVELLARSQVLCTGEKRIAIYGLRLQNVSICSRRRM